MKDSIGLARCIMHAGLFCRKSSFRDKPALPVPVRLVFSSNFDGDEEEHARALVTVFPEYFDELYECCEEYPAPEEQEY